MVINATKKNETCTTNHRRRRIDKVSVYHFQSNRVLKCSTKTCYNDFGIIQQQQQQQHTKKHGVRKKIYTDKQARQQRARARTTKNKTYTRQTAIRLWSARGGSWAGSGCCGRCSERTAYRWQIRERACPRPSATAALLFVMNRALLLG